MFDFEELTWSYVLHLLAQRAFVFLMDTSDYLLLFSN